MITMARASRMPTTSQAVPPSVPAWIKALATASKLTAATTGRLRQFRPATISRPITMAKATRKEISAAAATTGPVQAEKTTAIRPAIQRRTRLPSGHPCSGIRPVQLGMAVKRNPAIVAATYPNSSSWECHVTGVNAVGISIISWRTNSHPAIAITAQSPATRKKGRNPAESRGHTSADR